MIVGKSGNPSNIFHPRIIELSYELSHKLIINFEPWKFRETVCDLERYYEDSEEWIFKEKIIVFSDLQLQNLTLIIDEVVDLVTNPFKV